MFVKTHILTILVLVLHLGLALVLLLLLLLLLCLLLYLVLVLGVGAAGEAERPLNEETRSGFPPKVEFLRGQSDAQPHAQQCLQLW